MSNSAMSAFLDSCRKQRSSRTLAQDNVREADLMVLTSKVEKSVETFLVSSNLVSGTIRPDVACAANESFAPEMISTAIGIESIESLVRAAMVPDRHVEAAIEQVGIILHRHVGHRSPMSAWQQQLAKPESSNRTSSRGLETLYPESVMNEFNSRVAPGQESFGTNINMAIPDMKLAITVALMRFHTGLTPRVLPVRGTSEPMIQYVKSHLEVYDLGDMDKKPSRLIDLYEDPTPVRNELQQIVPRKANDAAGSASMLVADGIVRLGIKAELLKLSIDPDKFGYTKINKTDLVADNVKVKSVVFELTSGAVTEQFEAEFPTAISRLTRPSNAKDSADRNADLELPIFLNKESKTTLGTTSTILAAFTSVDEGLAIKLYIKPSINLKTGIAHALCSIAIAAHNKVNAAQLSAGAVTATAAITNNLIGYTLDAKFSEENIRKSNIAIRTHRQPFSYDLPTGRNYIYDYALGQQNPEENAANLTKVIRIGQDDIVLKVIRDTISHIYDQVNLFKGNPIDPDMDPGRDFVSGAMVRPTAFLGTLEIDKIPFIRASDRPGDIKQFCLTYLTAVVEELMKQSFYKQQLADGAAVTFKCITSSPILGNILGAPHIHNHLNNHDARGEDGSEYKLVLDNGAVLEVVTSTFNYMNTLIMLIPCIKDSPESILNFGHNWDYGTMVAHYTPGLSGESSHNRLLASARELPIVTTPIGALIDVTGMDVVTFLSIPVTP